jgi:hypothetical protein
MFNLLPQDTVFFDLFEGLSHHSIKAAEFLRQLARGFPHISGEIQNIRDVEHAADELTHAALARLDTTFITPFDREDIHTLANGLDDIVDTVDALAKRFTLYHVKEMEPSFIKQADTLVSATVALSEAVHRLRKSRKLSQLSDMLIEIHRLENVGDEQNHAAVSGLFEGNSKNAVEIIKWKELYDLVEEAIDRCEDVSHTLERIVLKNG